MTPDALFGGASLEGLKKPPPMVFGVDDPPPELGIRRGSGTARENENARDLLIRLGQTPGMAEVLKPKR